MCATYKGPQLILNHGFHYIHLLKDEGLVKEGQLDLLIIVDRNNYYKEVD